LLIATFTINIDAFGYHESVRLCISSISVLPQAVVSLIFVPDSSLSVCYIVARKHCIRVVVGELHLSTEL